MPLRCLRLMSPPPFVPLPAVEGHAARIAAASHAAR